MILPNVMIFVIIFIQTCRACNAHVNSAQSWAETKKERMEGYIVGGVQAKIETFPWLAQVIRVGLSHCGGVVISKRVILSAAHCVVDEDRQVLDPGDFEVILGSTIEGRGSDWYGVCKITAYPAYLSKKVPVYYYDLSAMLLTTEIKLSERVKIATIVPNGKWRCNKCSLVVAGYGVISNDRDPAERLYMTTMQFVDRNSCRRSPTDFGNLPLPLHVFCMLGNRPTSDCVGDSGSGVMWNGFVVGIVSHGRGSTCGSQVIPSMYVDLTYFRLWIKQTVRKLEAKSIDTCE